MLSNTTIHQSFKYLIDPRVKRTQKHECLNIVTITLCAVICGADNWVAIEEFGKSKLDWFKQFLDLPNGVPSHDTLSRFFSALDTKVFNELFVNWVDSISKRAKKLIPIDGKTMRGTKSPVKGLKGLHMVNAWCVENKLSLGQVSVDSKTNEITAIPTLLDILDIEGAIISLDAMGCQKKISKQITEKGADYIFSLKQNHGLLYDDVSTYFIGSDLTSPQFKKTETIEKNGGRIETRTCFVTNKINWLEKNGWENLQTIIMIKSVRETHNEVTEENRFYISSLDISASKMLEYIRGHWQIENNLHWSLDVGFNEDKWISKAGNAANNMAIINKIALNLLKKEKTAKVGVKNKRLKAAWDIEYLKTVIGAV